MTAGRYCAVYDFELMPYALGDVLTWNVQTAIQCEGLGRECVDVRVCIDERYPASIYQKGLVNSDNCGLFFSELFSAFATHPRLGNLLIYRDRDALLEELRGLAQDDAANAEALADYEQALANRDDESALIAYFTKYIYYHERINAFAAQHGGIPLLRPSMGCEPDVSGLLAKRFAGKRIVTIHTRLRRLDAGYGGEHTYFRDSDFLEWFEFLRAAETKHPDVQFVVLGRLQEKPLELLALPNVTSLRHFGLGLGHELTLMLRGDLFVGTSSGFAAMANFSTVPYFITKMNPESCKAYGIPVGATALPFATDRQVLVYEPETAELLMRLLERGLAQTPPRRGSGPELDPAIDVRSWEWERLRWLHPGATTSRFFTDETYRNKETAFLVWPKVREARTAWRKGARHRTSTLLRRIERCFPGMCEHFPEFLRLRALVAVDRNEWSVLMRCRSNLEQLALRDKGQLHYLKMLRRYVLWGFPTAMRIINRTKHIWRHRARIPRRLLELVRGRVAGLMRT